MCKGQNELIMIMDGSSGDTFKPFFMVMKILPLKMKFIP
jgi:hypothetical protein